MTDSIFQPTPSRFTKNGSNGAVSPIGVAPFELDPTPSRSFTPPPTIIPSRAHPSDDASETMGPVASSEGSDTHSSGDDSSGDDSSHSQIGVGNEPGAGPAVTPSSPPLIPPAAPIEPVAPSAMTPARLQPNGMAPVPSNQNRVDYLPMPTSGDLVNSPVLVIEHRHIEPAPMAVTPPPAPSWTLSQLLSVLGIMAVVAILGSAIGWVYGGRVEPTYAARSEFIYFLDDAVPDGFLREDRRILTQLVTIESETVLQPIAAQFDTTVSDLRDAISVEVVDLSEVIRLDVEDVDSDKALAINNAILSSYTTQADNTFSRSDPSGLVATRDRLDADLRIADEQSREIQIAEAEDVELSVIEESLNRELDIATQRFQNLSSIADGLLVETSTVDDTAAISSQITAANQTIGRLERELLSVRSGREEVQQTVRNTPEEFAYQANNALQRDVALSVREESIQTQITTAAERVRRLEGLRAESLVNNQVQPSAAPVGDRLASTEATMAELESQLLNVRTKRTQVAQRAAALPSLTREIERLEAELRSVEDALGDFDLSVQPQSPVEILTEPLVLDEPVGNPKVQKAALGFIASVPIAALAAAAVRSQQRKRPF